jgi:hypothetical protein
LAKSLAFGVALALAIAACGGRTEAQVRSCWSREVNYYARTYSRAFSNNRYPSHRLVASTRRYLSAAAASFSHGKLASGLATPLVETWLRSTQEKCGRLR